MLLHYDQAATDPERFFAHARPIRHLPREIAALGHEVDVVIAFPTDHEIAEDGVRYHFVRVPAITRHIGHRAAQITRRQPAALTPCLRAIRTIERLAPGVIHFHGTSVTLNLALLLRRYGRSAPPLVLQYHGGFPSSSPLVRRLQRRSFARVARFLFTVRSQAQPFTDAGLIDGSRVVELMETSTAFRVRPRQDARRETGMTGDPVFLWAGRLDPVKDPLTALRGFERVLVEWPDSQLYLHYLDDDLLPVLEERLRKRPRLRDHVHFRGTAEFERMEDIFNSADFLLQSSRREFSGYAVLEALACGVIPVVSDIPSLRSMTGDGRYGVLFPPGDAESLARGVTAIRREQIQRLSEQARAWFERSLSFPALARQLDTIYRGLGAEDRDYQQGDQNANGGHDPSRLRGVAADRPGDGAGAASRPASVVFMVPGFPADEADTSCLPAVQNYIGAYAAARPRIQVHVLAFQYPFERGTYRWKQAQVHALGGMNRRGLLRLATWARAVGAFLRVHRSTEVRVLHTFWLSECTQVGQWLARTFRVRHVASIGGQDARGRNPYFRYLDLDAPIVTAGSAFAADVFCWHTGRRVDSVIPLGLDTIELGAVHSARERDIDVLGVGSLIPLKDYAAFIDIVAALRSESPGLRACIVGGGPETEALRDRIVRRGLAGNIELAGELPRDKVFVRMLRSKLLLHTSRFESQGYVFLEALFAGIPVVCFDVGHTGDSSLVFRCTSTEQMIDVAGRLIRHPPEPRPQAVPTVQDTVRAFEVLYSGSD